MYETDDELIELLLIPKVGRARARSLFNAGFRTLEEIARAEPEQLAKVPGISVGNAAGIIESAKGMLAPRQAAERLESEARIDICPMCGSMVSAGSKVCNGCGITFSDEVEDLTQEMSVKKADSEDDGFWYRDQGKLFICPECGSLVADGAQSCPNCSVRFEEGEEETPKQPIAPAGDADGFWYKSGSKIAMCPNCGSFLGGDAKTCHSCGLVFETDEEEYLEPERHLCPMCKKDLRPGADRCEGCGFDFSAEKDKDGFWYKDQGGLFMCPNCGAFIPKDAERCSICNSLLEEGEDEGETEPQMTLCPMCGKPAAPGTEKCPGCGFDFSAEKDKDGFWYKDSVALFICPMCGAFMSEAADRCANCGAAFDEDDAVREGAPEPPALSPAAAERKADDIIELVEIEQELEAASEPEPSGATGIKAAEPEALSLCPVCGAFSRGGETKCPACGAVFDDIEEMELGAAVSAAKGIDNLELAKEMAAEIEEIEAELLEPPKKPSSEKRGVSKDFLDRWKRLDGNGPAGQRPGSRGEKAARGRSDEDDAQLDDENLMAGIEELTGESRPPESWTAEAKELAADGRLEEAVACLDRAAEADPDRELDYKRLMLELMGVGLNEGKTDLSQIAAIDDIGDLRIDEGLVSGALESRLNEIDAKLKTGDGDSSLWQEKGEILEKMGRHEEAVKCFDTSITMTYAELRKESATTKRPVPQIGIGLTNGQGRVNGRVNGLLIQRGLHRGETDGLTNGRTNGRVNGLRVARGKINGMVNGLAGRINGLTNGKINGTGLVNGRTNGRINGTGIVNGSGMADAPRAGLINGGLVNGLGLVNGEAMVGGAGTLRRLRRRRRERVMWRYRLTAMALFVTLVLMVSMLGNLMLDEESGAVSIDGSFSDWDGVESYSNFLGQPASPEIRILETGMVLEGDSIKVRVEFEAPPFSASGSSADSVWMFVDADCSRDTGYAIEGMGTDLAAEIYGWDGAGVGSRVLRFGAGANRSDWNGFENAGSADYAAAGRAVEASFRMPRDAVAGSGGATVLVVSVNSEGGFDMTDYYMSGEGGGNAAALRHSGLDTVVPGETVALGELTLSAHSSAGTEFEAVEFALTGTEAPDIVLRDRAGTELQTRQIASGKTVRLEFLQPIALAQEEAATLAVEARMPSRAGGTAGIMLEGANATGGSRVRDINSRVHNIGTPSAMTVDGAFGDWADVGANPDRADDMVAGNGTAGYVNMNVDLSDARLSGTGGTLFFYASVRGMMLGGADLPLLRSRPGPPQPVQDADSDRDSVPDSLDPYYLDFNNDGIPDVNSLTSSNAPDIDGDYSPDYPAGSDWWLNTTIPADVEAPYGGAAISIYIGPVNASHQENLGDDRAYIMFDTDSDPGTGSNLRGAPGIEFAVVVSGKQNRIMAAELYVSDPAHAPTGWRFVLNVSAAADWTRLEGSVTYYALGLGPGDNFTAHVAFEDWSGGSDISDTELAAPDLAVAVSATRSPAGDSVVINELAAAPNNGEWVEICNPTASAVDITGWRLRMGNTNLAVFQANTVLGAFSSGSEFLVVTLYSNANDLANGGGTVVLQRPAGAAWTTLDSFSYGALAAGQSWARFKNVTYGMPADTDSAADYYLSSAPTQGAHNDRTAPSVAVAKAGDRAYALPGDTVTYTIWYNNTGEGNARHVWINDTLPAGMTFISSSSAYSSVSGQTYGWHFDHVSPGPHSFTVSVTVNAGVPAGTVLTNNVLLQYTDQLSRPWGASSDSWDVTVQVPPPQFSIAKTSANPVLTAGSEADFTVYYNNTGTGSAADVWLNDTLPAGMSYVSGSPAPSSVSGQVVSWHFQSVAPGSYQATLTALVATGTPAGTVLTNSVTCDYADSAGDSYPRETAQASVIVAAPSALVVINEIAPNPNPEWVEICNPTDAPVDLSGWRIYATNFLRYTFPPGTVLGAWGSGSEYIVATMTQNNRFSNSGELVRLTTGTGTEIDRTTYSAVADGQTWSRFKHEDTGKPVDTGGTADWYISNSAWLAPEGPTPAAPNDRKRPIMNVGKSASPLIAEPGQLVTYTIWYNNTGDGNAKDVWVNDTLPAGMDYVSATPAPTTVSGQDIVWYFNNVNHDTVNSITLTARMSALPSDGAVLINTATMVYHDALRRPMGGGTDSAGIACSRAVISVRKVSDVAQAAAGGTVVYTIYYNNTGSAAAGSVWINDTLPAGVTFISASAPPAVSGGTLSWHLTNVAPGAHSITVTVAVNATAGSGTITNWAFLDYASNYGTGLGQSSDSATVVIPEMGHLAVPVLGILLVAVGSIRNRRRRNGKIIRERD